MIPLRSSGTVMGDQDPENSDSGPSKTPRPAVKRTSKACEACRSRRRRCDGLQPCQTCVRSGEAMSCHFRIKARPGSVFKTMSPPIAAALPSAPSLDAPDPPHPSPLFFELVQERLEGWARDNGKAVDLSVDTDAPWSKFMDQPLPALPGDPQSRASALETFQATYKAYFVTTLTFSRASSLLDRFETSPESLTPDQIATVLSCLCLGRERELALRREDDEVGPAGMDTEEETDDIAFFRLAMAALDHWGGASPTALTALDLLHMFLINRGGPNELRALLGRLAWQCKELGVHRTASCRSYPRADKVEQLFYGALYKDAWFATLYLGRPYFTHGEFEHTWTTLPSKDELRRGLDAFPFLVDLTLIENGLLSSLRERPASFETVVSFERRLSAWWDVFRTEQKREKKHVMLNFAEIRFHW
ncbi:hypothetical protein JCM24511_06198 [Saitozyma sp. JCM 24511]|nr:hypothetical protein JCM24511_06198 [Saitozyma sp. JCM 24511]